MLVPYIFFMSLKYVLYIARVSFHTHHTMCYCFSFLGMRMRMFLSLFFSSPLLPAHDKFTIDYDFFFLVAICIHFLIFILKRYRINYRPLTSWKQEPKSINLMFSLSPDNIKLYADIKNYYHSDTPHKLLINSHSHDEHIFPKHRTRMEKFCVYFFCRSIFI